ncbi:hypothetical protein N431DRAFT_485032 [Stipitochalara longipes BDJ]|nr:hypothetical protein N431DRAFT_485032 [Stipitochalara longipes BDJ]
MSAIVIDGHQIGDIANRCKRTFGCHHHARQPPNVDTSSWSTSQHGMHHSSSPPLLCAETAALDKYATAGQVLELDDYHEIAHETRDARNVSPVLKADDSMENLANNVSQISTREDQLRDYPGRYSIPKAIIDRIDLMEDKIKPIFPDLGHDEEEEIQKRYVEGLFQEDLWYLDNSMRILACWSPGFGKEVAEEVESRPHENLRETLGIYIQKYPVRFGFQVLGGVTSIASIVALPVLGVLGFGAAGPIAGSVAAGWQSISGLVQVRTLFAWCQSATMSGAALSGILVTGLSGAGIAVAAASQVLRMVYLRMSYLI